MVGKMCKNKTWQHKRGMNKCKEIMYVAKYVHGNMARARPVCFFVDEEEPQALEGWREDSRASTVPSRSLMLYNHGERRPLLGTKCGYYHFHII